MAKGPVGFIEFDIVGNERGVERMLASLDSALSPFGMTAFMHAHVEPWLIKRARDRFAGEGDDAVGKWAPLQDSTIEIREAAGFGPGPINVRTHELEEYITQASGMVRSGPGTTSISFPGKVSGKKSIREKMSTAQRGKASPNTPPRPVLGLGERDLSEVLVGLAFHVQNWARTGI